MSQQQNIFVETFISEARLTGDYRGAARKALETAGYSDTTKISQIFGSEGLKDKLMEGVSLELIQMIPKLLNALERVIDNPAIPGAKNIIAAAGTLLDRAGCVKVEKVNVEVKAPDGVLILPSKTPINNNKE